MIKSIIKQNFRYNVELINTVPDSGDVAFKELGQNTRFPPKAKYLKLKRIGTYERMLGSMLIIIPTFYFLSLASDMKS